MELKQQTVKEVEGIDILFQVQVVGTVMPVQYNGLAVGNVDDDVDRHYLGIFETLD